MAQRRMFSPQIVSSDAFLEMPTSSRELYFQLGMYADDDGFVQPKKIIRMVSASEDDLKVLLSKKFVLQFESGVIVIKHWRMNNLLRKDRYRTTEYFREKSKLFIRQNMAYTLNPEGSVLLDKIDWQPYGNQLAPQDRIGKDRIGYINTKKGDLIKRMKI